jgi:SNF2 family DNA or RNA helicase
MREFYPHQHDAFHYLLEANSGALFMEMRLGKTLVVVRWLDYLSSRTPGHRFRTLVVAPNSALHAWENELELEGEDNVVRPSGTRKKRLEALATLPKWCLLNKEAFLSVPQIAQHKWDAVIVDESTFLKGPKAKVSRFYATNFRDVPHRCIMSGLPNPEGSLDFFQQFKFLYGNMMGHANYWSFRQRFFHPGGFLGYDWIPNRGTDEAIKKWVAANAFILRRKDVNMDVPKVNEKRFFSFPPKLKSAYRKAEKEFVLTGLDGEEIKETQWALAKYTWLRRMCGGFLDDKHVWLGKLNGLVELLTNELAEDQVVVWFAFNPEIEVVKEALVKAGVSCHEFWGAEGMKSKDRGIIRRRFQNKEIRVLLTQVSCAALGMDLSAADTAIYFSNSLRREHRSQSEDRILALQKEGPLLLLDLLVENSADEDVHDLLRDKKWKGSMFMHACRRMQERVRDGKR